MADIICNLNAYSVFLEGKASKEEGQAILKQLMAAPLLMAKLNLAAACFVGLEMLEKAEKETEMEEVE